jgi:putative flippase GtrA
MHEPQNSLSRCSFLTNKFFTHYRPLIFEFFRYFIAGGLAFIVDFGILYLVKKFFFRDAGLRGVLLATACGFAGGLVTNYILSSIFVFKKISEKAKQHKIRSFIVFTIICIIGFGLTELFMYTGVRLAGERWYLLVKCFVAGIVLIWNYVSKKAFVFQRNTSW